MSREIKFRFWDEEEEIMIFCNDEYAKFSIWGGSVKLSYWTEFAQVQNGEIVHNNTWDDVVGVGMQYTGLKDKNGKEIYEGDILSVPYVTPMGDLTEDEDKDNRAAVGFDFGSFVLLYPGIDNMPIQQGCKRETGPYVPNYGNPTIYSDATVYEVIGNIYENPELLK